MNPQTQDTYETMTRRVLRTTTSFLAYDPERVFEFWEKYVNDQMDGDVRYELYQLAVNRAKWMEAWNSVDAIMPFRSPSDTGKVCEDCGFEAERDDHHDIFCPRCRKMFHQRWWVDKWSHDILYYYVKRHPNCITFQ